MSRKHNTQHPDRGRSNYPQRLAARGLVRTPEMTSPEVLRRRQTSADFLAANPDVRDRLIELNLLSPEA